MKNSGFTPLALMTKGWEKSNTVYNCLAFLPTIRYHEGVRKVFFFIAFIFLFLFLSLDQIEATSHVKFRTNPENLFPGGMVDFIIEGGNAFNPSLDYFYKAWNLSTGEGNCKIEGKLKPSSTDQLIVKDDILSGCAAQIGEWTFQLWLLSSSGDTLIISATFLIQQPGGGLPGLEPLQPTVLANQDPSVIIMNARKDNLYSIWWKDAKMLAAAGGVPYKAPDNGNFVIGLERTLGIDFGLGKTVTLCMDLGSSAPLLVNSFCRFRTVFTFVDVVPPESTKCTLIPENPGNDIPVSIKAAGLTPNTDYRVTLTSGGSLQKVEVKNSGTASLIFFDLGNNLPNGSYNFSVFGPANQKICDKTFAIIGKTSTVSFTPIPPFNPTKCTPPGGAADSGIDTAVGCIPTNLAGFVGKIFGIILGLAGGIALLLIIYSGYRMATEGSNPESLQGARETLTSAIVGLLFIIFSFVILEVIGVDILRIPGFGGSGRTTTDDGRQIPIQCRNAPYALDHVSLCGNQLVIDACNGLKTDAENGVILSNEDRAAFARCVRESFIISPSCLRAKFALENFDVCGELQTKAACSILREEVNERGGTAAATDEERATLNQCQQKGF